MEEFKIFLIEFAVDLVEDGRSPFKAFREFELPMVFSTEEEALKKYWEISLYRGEDDIGYLEEIFQISNERNLRYWWEDRLHWLEIRKKSYEPHYEKVKCMTWDSRVKYYEQMMMIRRKYQ